MLAVGDRVPDFSATTDAGETIRLSDLRGKKVVLYFYPKDHTPHCTTEACSFRDSAPEFESRNAVILGVSGDSVKSHGRFKSRHGLPFPLISDSDYAICKAFGVWRRFFGRTPLSIARATFVIDETGRIAAVYRKVRVRSHVGQVLSRL